MEGYKGGMWSEVLQSQTVTGTNCFKEVIGKEEQKAGFTLERQRCRSVCTA